VATAVGRLLGHYTSGQMVWEPFDSHWVQGVTIVEIFGSYLRKLMLPISLNNSYPLKTHTSLFEPGVLFGLLVMVGMVILIVKCKRRYPLVSFGLVWYLVAWLPHAQIIAIPPALRADRYVYYSSPGLFLAMVFFAEQWVRTTAHLFNAKQLRFAMGVSCCVLVGMFASMTVVRNNVWSNSISLWCDSVKKDHQNLLAHTNLGKAYEEAGMLEKAISEHTYVLAMNTTSAVAHYNLGSVYAKQERLDEAITAYKRSLVLDPRYPEAHNDLGNAYYKKNRLDEAIYEHKQSLALDPDYEKAYLNLGVAYGGEGRLDEAIVAFKRACRINPYFADAHNNLSVAYYYKGEYALAIEHYAQAQKLGFGVNQKLLALLKPYL
jgi:tetratricopeptide (TPR) repeat protein